MVISRQKASGQTFYLVGISIYFIFKIHFTALEKPANTDDIQSQNTKKGVFTVPYSGL